MEQENTSPIITTLIHPYMPHHKLAFEYFNGNKVSDEARELVQSGNNGYYKHDPKDTNPQKFVNLLDNAKKVMTEFVKAQDEPQMLITFGSSSFDSELKTVHRGERMKTVLGGGIQHSIPCISSFACGVVGTTPEMECLEMEAIKFPCLTSMAIPKAEGLKIKPFVITEELDTKEQNLSGIEECKRILGIHAADEAQLMGIILIYKGGHQASPSLDAILQYLRSKPQVALAGGIYESVLVSGTDDAAVVAAGLLIYGNDSVRVSSVGFFERRIPENNKKKLEELHHVVEGTGSFAFAFACNDRGQKMHESPNAESNLFHSLFPHTPLVGAFTLGEFCHEVIPFSGESSIPPPKKIGFSCTTSYLIVSYGHPVEANEVWRKFSGKEIGFSAVACILVILAVIMARIWTGNTAS